MTEIKNPYVLYKAKYCENCTDDKCPVYDMTKLPSEQKAHMRECAEMNRIISTLIND